MNNAYFLYKTVVVNIIFESPCTPVRRYVLATKIPFAFLEQEGFIDRREGTFFLPYFLRARNFQERLEKSPKFEVLIAT